MTRIEPDGLIDSFDPRTKAEHPDEKPAYLRSTVLRAGREALSRYDVEREYDDPEEEAFVHGASQALTQFLARFQPTEGDQDG